ncbi:hypothetical protein ACFTQ7_07015 [Lysinibacillus sp. NPDC056959]|uniref:hypothetical protein n=1 Tax=Lysinibacillus sp. NPDC056959 TaxID=3345981 RepID=UPI00363ECF73
MKNEYVQIEITEDVTHKLFTGIGFIIRWDEREYESGGVVCLTSFSKCFRSESETPATNVFVAKVKRQLQVFSAVTEVSHLNRW